MRLFGTDGIRAVANTGYLTPESCVRIGRAAARYFLKNCNITKIAVGKDTRHSGDMIESSLAAGFSSEGMDVFRIGVIPTPGAAFVAKNNKFAGCVVSASHNPGSDNGIKFFRPDGRKLAEDGEKRIEEYYFSEAMDKMGLPAEMLGRINPVNPDYIESYKKFLKGFVKKNGMKRKRIVIDCANGAASVIAEGVFSAWGAELIIINAFPDGFNINENCGATCVDSLKKTVIDKKALLGIAFDGDADRAVIIDETGSYIDGDLLLFVIALDMMKKGNLPGKRIVATEYSNYGLDISLKRLGINVVRVENSDRLVENEMSRINSPLGGENTGHIILGEYSRTGDGILTALSVLKIMNESGKKLSELTSGMHRLPQKLVNVEVREKRELSKIPNLKSRLEQANKLLAGSGRIFIRYSGTQNLCRILVEAEDRETVEKIAKDISGHIRKAIG